MYVCMYVDFALSKNSEFLKHNVLSGLKKVENDLSKFSRSQDLLRGLWFMVQSTHGSKGSKTKKEKFIFGQKTKRWGAIEIRGSVFPYLYCFSCFVDFILMRIVNLLKPYRYNKGLFYNLEMSARLINLWNEWIKHMKFLS